MPFLKSVPEHGTAFDIFTAFPALYTHIGRFSEEIFRGDGPLPRKHRETIFAFVSGANACAYCFGGHAATAAKLGLDPAAFDALKVDIDAAQVDDALKPLLRFADKLNRTPARMTQADADACFAAGWDDAALNQTIALTCLANFMNRLVEGAGIEADASRFERRAEMAATEGYWAPFARRLKDMGIAAE